MEELGLNPIPSFIQSNNVERLEVAHDQDPIKYLPT